MEHHRFVVQEHTTAEGVHWDLMLEEGEVLVTFRLEERPEEALRHPVGATKIFDHPLRFLSYEGPVQKGAGQVRIVDRGTYRCDEQGEDRWVLTLSGTILRGDFTLARAQGDAWRFAVE
ncbi:MAG: DNA polymerase ligase N-terminal domain-containing protein [Planctomycetota bacterium]|jgi:hypothetical protein